MPFRPARGSALGSHALRQALSNAAAASNGIPHRAASAKIWSLDVPTIESTYPGALQRAIQPPRRHCCSSPSIMRPANAGVNRANAGQAVR